MIVNGIDFKIFEPKHPKKPINTKYALQKFKSFDLRYKLGISIKTGLCVWIKGPHPARAHDMTNIWKAFKYKIQPGKAVIANHGY